MLICVCRPRVEPLLQSVLTEPIIYRILSRLRSLTMNSLRSTIISLEQQLIGEANSPWRALSLLIASRYVYNVVYHPLLKLFFLFFEEHVFNFPSINRGCKNAVYSSVVSEIESFVP